MKYKKLKTVNRHLYIELNYYFLYNVVVGLRNYEFV